MDAGNSIQPLSSNGNGNGNGNGKAHLPIELPGKTPLEVKPLFQEEDQEDLNIRQLLTIVKRRFILIAGVAIGVLGAVAAWTFTQDPIYEGKFQLLVEPITAENQVSKLAQIPQMAESLEDSRMDYQTQIEVLSSTELMNPLIEQLQARYPDLDYKSLIIEKKLRIQQLPKTKIIQVTYRDSDPQEVKFVLEQIAKAYLRYSIQERQTNVKQGIRFVEGQLPNLRQRVDKLQGQLQAFRQRYNLLDPDAQATQLTNRVSQVEQQLLDTQVKLNESQSLYSNLQQQLRLQPNQAIAATSLSEAPRYQQLLNKLQEIEAKIAVESARFLDDSPVMQSLRQQRENLLPLLQQEASSVIGNNLPDPTGSSQQSLSSPSTIRLNLTQQYVDAANQVQVLEVKSRAIAQAAQRLNQQVRYLPVIARQYTDLQRELNVATESLNRFLTVRETLQIEAAQNSLPWQIISKPEQPEEPVFPKPLLNLLLGGAAGVMLGMGAALLAERLDNVFHSPEELKDAIRLPILGLIPQQRQIKPFRSLGHLIKSKQKPQETAKGSLEGSHSEGRWYNSSPFLESFRSLHTNIRFLGSDTPIHALVVSSASPSDGKSTISVHLAQAAAAMGQRVLLVDADLRRPQVHHILGLENQKGLSNVIATGLTPREAIQKLPDWENLYVLTAGQIPPDPTRLLSSKRMQYLMDQLQAVFDLVIYDTPPLLGLADGRLLAVHTSGVVMVTRLSKTDRSIFHQALDTLRISSTPVLGVVANGVKRSSSNSYYYASHYHAPQESEVENAKRLLQNRFGNR